MAEVITLASYNVSEVREVIKALRRFPQLRRLAQFLALGEVFAFYGNPMISIEALAFSDPDVKCSNPRCMARTLIR